MVTIMVIRDAFEDINFIILVGSELRIINSFDRFKIVYNA